MQSNSEFGSEAPSDYGYESGDIFEIGTEKATPSYDEIVIPSNGKSFGYYDQLTRSEYDYIVGMKLDYEQSNNFIRGIHNTSLDPYVYQSIKLVKPRVDENAKKTPVLKSHIKSVSGKAPSKRKTQTKESSQFNRGMAACWTCYLDQIQPKLDSKVSYFAYQREICPNTKKLHFQGYTQFHSKTTAFYLKNWLNDKGAHIEIQRGTNSEARDYCTPDTPLKCRGWKTKRETGEYVSETFVEKGLFNPNGQGFRSNLKDVIVMIESGESLFQIMKTHSSTYSHNTRFIKEYKARYQLELLKAPDIILKPWQILLYDMFRQAPVHRRIFWIWSSESGTGKSTFMVWVHANMKTDMLSVESFKYADILYAYEDHKVIYFDIPRCQDRESVGLVDNVLEKLSNTSIKLSTKYESVQKFVCAHIVVTSNYAPPVDRIPHRFFEVCLSDKLLGPSTFKITDHNNLP